MTTYGLFDSGIGGLSVLKALFGQQPDINAIYLADTAWVPYGTKPPAQLKARIHAIVQWLAPQVDTLVVACNTSAALMQGQWPTQLPVIDPITATALAFETQPDVTRLAVMATPNTVASKAYVSALQQVRPDITVTQCACPGLADAVESNQLETIEPLLIDWLTMLWAEGLPDALVLGCTHYPFAADAIKQAMQRANLPKVPLFDPAMTMASQLTLPTGIPGERQLRLMTTGQPSQMHTQVLGLPLPDSIQSVYPEALMQLS